MAYRAALLLTVGRTDEANADIAQVLSQDANDSNALALQTIIAIVQNEQARALGLAQQAVSADPNSATALIALSYAQQAVFDLEGAQASLEQAVSVAPQNALAWARLAELHSSFGRLDQALDTAQQAVGIEPNLSRTQTVLGFAYLTQVKTRPAREAFERAIALDQADPLPRLGLGLAQIREGDLPPGRRDVEIAASLDPNNALIRSYLGKAYFEEKRPDLDHREYEVAQGLDPQDPTPWFYDAIAKQTTNRPVEALRGLQKAIDLNDNRAIYRSRLLLDSDLAARSSALARIYSDLGFRQLGLVEGWKSVNTDPSNFSAHRFLADSYSVLPRHEIARVSELFQSQMLQPLNITPIQPRLAESNLFLISAGGPGALSFNEFTPLFLNGNRVSLLSSGFVGSNDTRAGESVVSGIYHKTSYSVGYSYFDTDGYRTNNDQKDEIVNAFIQQEISHKTSVQAEYRHRDTEFGDLQQRFFRDDIFRNLRNDIETDTYRVGGRHSFSPSSILLGSFVYQNRKDRLRDEPPPFPGLAFVDLRLPQDAYSVEVQHLFRSRYFDLTSGAGYFDVDGHLRTALGIDLPPPPDGPGLIEIFERTNTSLQHVNAYAYASARPAKTVLLTVGGSFDYVNGDAGFIPGGDKKQFNPKAGITWEPILGTTLRAAAFRTMKRTLITDQTLEPTQLAGFNQFFDDINTTEAWRYGGAIDQKFTHSIFGGMEFAYRDLEVPTFDFSEDPENPSTQQDDAEEYLGRAYILWAPHDWLSLRAEYLYERFKFENPSTEQPKKLTTHRVPFGLNLFHPSGLNASLTATYMDQHGKFGRLVSGEIESGSDDFWLVDAAINFRLPKRYGFVTLGVSNLTDEKFKYYEVDFDNPSIIPDRMLFARVTLAMP